MSSIGLRNLGWTSYARSSIHRRLWLGNAQMMPQKSRRFSQRRSASTVCQLGGNRPGPERWTPCGISRTVWVLRGLHYASDAPGPPALGQAFLSYSAAIQSGGLILSRLRRRSLTHRGRHHWVYRLRSVALTATPGMTIGRTCYRRISGACPIGGLCPLRSEDCRRPLPLWQLTLISC